VTLVTCMPAKYTIKQYLEGGFYHVYNRGVEKRNIFIDDQDYYVFLNYLRLYLLPKDQIYEEIKNKKLTNEEFLQKTIMLSHINNFYKKINLLSFCLMPNHFHLQLRQKGRYDMDVFIQSLLTKYVRYFNKKYNRVGPLFSGRYKAILIEKEEYLLHLSRYIHLNPKEILPKGKSLVSYPWSSYPAYVKEKVSWLDCNLILSYFKKIMGYGFSSYQGFVEGYQDEKNPLLENNIYIDL